MPFKKGHKPYYIRKVGEYTHSEETKKKMSQLARMKGIIPPSRKGIPGRDLYNWKGEDAGYGSKHDWIRKHYGNANNCSFNPTHESTFEWANISGNYLRDIDDWSKLCSKCHKQYDSIRRGYFAQ